MSTEFPPDMPERLRAYYQRTNEMTFTEKASHLRTDEKEESQAWPDFLDFLDEWASLYKQKLQQTRKDYVFTVLARHGVTIKCRAHTHTFSHEPDPRADVIIPSPDTNINPDACWWREITRYDSQLTDLDANATAVQLSTPEAKAIQKLTSIQMVTQESLPPSLLTFEKFRDQWWKTPTHSRAMKILLESDQPYHVLNDIVRSIKVQDTPQPPRWLNLGSSTVPDLIQTNTDVLQDHGLHALMRVRHDRHEIFRLISSIRAEANPEGLLHPDRLAQAMRDCDLCKRPPRSLSTSYPGVYYSPPGNGKTTSLKTEVFIGVDTDWLLKNSNFDAIIKPFLSKSVPIITNQYHLAAASGTRFFGAFNPHQLRINPVTNHPYTTLTEIEKARTVLRADLFLLYTDQYFSDVLPLLYRAAYLYEFTQYIWLQKSVKAKFIKHKFEDLPLPVIIAQIDRWKSSLRASARQLRRRRRRHSET